MHREAWSNATFGCLHTADKCIIMDLLVLRCTPIVHATQNSEAMPAVVPSIVPFFPTENKPVLSNARLLHNDFRNPLLSPCRPLCNRPCQLAHPYYIFTSHGYSVTIASIKGGEIPVDEASLAPPFLTPGVEKFLLDGKPALHRRFYDWWIT